MAHNSSHFFLILLLSALIATLPSTLASAERDLFRDPKYHVKIINELGYNKKLEVHCKSGDDDKGFQMVPPGNSYEFGFHINFWGTTLYFCNLWQDPIRQYHAVFDVFDATLRFRAAICGGLYCTWIARDDGIYSYNSETKHRTFRHYWEAVRRGPGVGGDGDRSFGPVAALGPSSKE